MRTLSGDRPSRVRQTPWASPPSVAERPHRDALPPIPNRVHRRWDRLVRLLGDEGVRRMMQTHVAVFGMGGVGSYAVEALARSALGRVTLVDFDDVCLTNINRQLHALDNTVGQSKVALMAERVRAINPEAWVDPIQAFYDQQTSEACLTPQPDYVIDAIDNITSKVLILETCLTRGIPVISITGAGARMDPTQVRVDDLANTRVDPLARILRKELSKRGYGNEQSFGLPVVFSEEEVREPETPAWDEARGFHCICPHRADSPHACEKRRVIYGTATFVAAAFGLAAASHVVRSITSRPIKPD